VEKMEGKSYIVCGHRGHPYFGSRPCPMMFSGPLFVNQPVVAQGMGSQDVDDPGRHGVPMGMG
jgi:hypothetical protein